MKKLTNEQMREKFANSGLTYQSIAVNELARLEQLLRQELISYINEDKYIDFTMKLSAPRIKDNTKNLVGYIKKAFFHCDGYIDDGVKLRNHFKRREAISFNSDGFIGFAGWADSRNVQPFLNAFDKWIDELIEPK